MKKLLILPLLVLLTGCVSYYYPETALEDGVYYAEDDPSYVVYSGAYSGVAYYPWYSLDYFYMGYYPYPGFSVGYGYPSGFSIGFSYAFAPWYYPGHYYGYYSPWYGSHHHHHHYAYHPAWRPYRGYYSGRHGDRNKKHQRDDRHDRYAGNDRRNSSNDKDGRDGYASDGRRPEQPESNRSSSVRRYVSTAPSGQSGNRGVVIRNRDAAKVGKSRLQVDGSGSTTGTTTKSAQAEAAVPDYNVNRGVNEVPYRSNAKQTRSRTSPVDVSASSKGVVVKAAPVKSTRSSSGNTRQKAATRPPSPPKASSPSRSKVSNSNKRSSSVSHSSSKGKSTRRKDRS